LMGGCICGIAYALITQPKPMWVENETVYTTNQTTWIEKTERWDKFENIKLNTSTAGSGKQDRSTEKSSKRYAKLVLVKGFAEDSVATIVNTVYYNEVGIDMNMTMKWENWSFELTTQSKWIHNWKRERSFWNCQLMEIYHAPFIWKDWYTKNNDWTYTVKNPSWFSTGFLDPITHAQYCVSVWRDAEKKWRLSTTFYAYNTRKQFRNIFTIKDM
jgi:hypothetical protein